MRTKVILRQLVAQLGDVGDIVTVAGGYARNYLFPRGLAVAATKGNVKHADTWRSSRATREGRERTNADELKSKLEAQPLTVTAQAGPDGRLFGSVTAAQISEAISTTLGADIDRHTIDLPEPIRHLGLHEVQVRVHAEVTAQVTVEVIEGSAA